MKIIGEFWSRGSEKFSGDTGEVTNNTLLPVSSEKFSPPHDQNSLIISINNRQILIKKNFFLFF